jgi:hypothetical protein
MQVDDCMAILNCTDRPPMHNRLARCSVIAAQCCIVYAAKTFRIALGVGTCRNVEVDKDLDFVSICEMGRA